MVWRTATATTKRALMALFLIIGQASVYTTTQAFSLTATCSTGSPCSNITETTISDGIINLSWSGAELQNDTVIFLYLRWGISRDKWKNSMFAYFDKDTHLVRANATPYTMVLPDYYIPAGDYYWIEAHAGVSGPYDYVGPLKITARDNYPIHVQPTYNFIVSLLCENDNSCSEDQTTAYIGENIIVKWTLPTNPDVTYDTASVKLYWNNPNFYNTTGMWDGLVIVNSDQKYSPGEDEKGIRYPITDEIPPGSAYYIAITLSKDNRYFDSSYAGAFTVAPRSLPSAATRLLTTTKPYTAAIGFGALVLLSIMYLV